MINSLYILSSFDKKIPKRVYLFESPIMGMIKPWVWGSFVVLHWMHLSLFRRAIEDAVVLGNDSDFELSVTVITDKEVSARRNNTPPLFNENERLDFIKRLPYVNQSHIDDYDHGMKSLIEFNPDYIFLGEDQTKSWDTGLADIIRKNSLKAQIVVVNNRYPKKIESSTSIRGLYNDNKTFLENQINKMIQSENDYYSTFITHLNHMHDTRLYFSGGSNGQ
jgi:glycerol-3-phosphate cytidylyltransferase-like family protein